MRQPATDAITSLDDVLQFERSSASLEDRAAVLTALREDTATALKLDLKILDRLRCQHRALLAAKENHAKLEAVLEKLTAPPLLSAAFITLVPPPRLGSPRALVRHGTTDRVVGFAEGVDGASLRAGDAVFLARELNVIVERGPAGAIARTGETCTFERRVDAGRLLVRSRDEELILYAAPALTSGDLKPGCQLRFDRSTLIAYEPIERSQASQFFLEETPRETFADVGGLGPQIARITSSLALHFDHGDIARRYRLPPKASVLLCGPAGTGKTLIAKALANWLARRSPGDRAFFMNIKPSALHSMWFSQSEANYREVFRVARETATAHPGTRVVLFFDEVDAIGGTRGVSHMRVHDNVLTAFAAELDGLTARGDVLVISATNRPDSLDPALLRPGRLGDLVLDVPRPDRRGAAEIFAKHLAVDIPYGRNGHGDDLATTRAEIIERAVSTIYSPNGESELATLTFRDGQKRSIRAPDLISGALIANLARSAAETACLREVTNNGCVSVGVTWPDVAAAIDHEFATAARTLTPANCRHHLSLPHDLDVVNVETVRHPAAARSTRFLNEA